MYIVKIVYQLEFRIRTLVKESDKHMEDKKCLRNVMNM